MFEESPTANGALDGLPRWRQALAAGSFEETYQALEQVVAHLERGQLPLADTLACYELGVRLAARCGGILDAAELRVSRLDQTLGLNELVDGAFGDDPDDERTG
jgi:exodeoxyribonuclease VII small subunit